MCQHSVTSPICKRESDKLPALAWPTVLGRESVYRETDSALFSKYMVAACDKEPVCFLPSVCHTL